MFALLMAIWIVIGALAFGGMMMIGSMLFTGKWTLPGTDQRVVQQSKNRLRLAQLEAQRVEQQYQISQTLLNKQLMELQAEERIDDMRDKVFNKQLEQSNGG